MKSTLTTTNYDSILKETSNWMSTNDLHKKIGTDRSNLEHLFYILPIHALEIARRTNCNLSAYFVQSKRGLKHAIWHLINGNIRHAYAELFSKPEQYTTIYCYEFTKNS